MDAYTPHVLGIDIGGTGIKGAPVDVTTGMLLAPRHRLRTPDPASPGKVAQVIAEIVHYFEWDGPIGCGFPAVVRAGVTLTAANVHKQWIGADAAALFTQATGCPVHVLNDADAAGLAEVTFGAGKGHQGVLLMVTVGTGWAPRCSWTALVPNTELGHIEINGEDAEANASDAARKRDDLRGKVGSPAWDRYLPSWNACCGPT
jgi:polyphosphate glucokinase